MGEMGRPMAHVSFNTVSIYRTCAFNTCRSLNVLTRVCAVHFTAALQMAWASTLPNQQV